MSDPRIDKMAMLLVDYCVAVKPGERVMIYASALAMPLVTATYKQVVKAGGNPLVMLQDEVFQEIMLREGSDEQLQHVPEPVKLIFETYDCRIAIRGASNTRSLSSIDPKRMQITQAANKELMAISMKRSAAGELRWVGTLYPTHAHAQEADMSLSEYEDFVYSACYADKDDPVAEWLKMSKKQQLLVDWLKGKRDVRVKGPNVDMTLSIDERTFINSDGKRNMPSGEIFTGPVESSVNGWVRFTYPAIVASREVDGVELRFENGKVVDASAQKNEDFLLKTLDIDDGARYLGEFAIGTNNGIDRFTKSILYDEKIGGTIHMALGMGYPETGSQNKSSIHWDMICDMRDGGQIWVDDELFYDGGKFMV
ncbi:MAG TPA: aminopeptidase [candidate division Zixibacteria bacterium]|nr:aminopeptidase [candidate division Zixibacteria bacterium]